MIKFSKKTIAALSIFLLAHIVLVALSTSTSVLPAAFGAAALSAMALSFVLAARWKIVEKLLGGRDRTYIVHRWLGYASFVGLAVHWIIAEDGAFELVPSVAGAAAELATFASTSILLLGALSALKHIPYHIWIWTHRLFGPLYILLVFHSFFSPSPIPTASLVWNVLWLISVLGIIAWFSSLQRLFKPDLPYKVISLEHKNNYLDLRLKPLTKAHHWKAGQFANLTPTKKGFEESHPFSIASAPHASGEMRFVIRELGDFSQALPKALKQGDTVLVSKPAGSFKPKTKPYAKPQLWLAGGVGITPFLAALDAFNEHSPQTTLLYCITNEASAIDLEKLREYEQHFTNFSLIVFDSSKGNRLNTENFATHLPSKATQGDLFICGAPALKEIATQAWKKAKATGNIHHEYFDFRAAVSLDKLIKQTAKG